MTDLYTYLTTLLTYLQSTGTLYVHEISRQITLLTTDGSLATIKNLLTSVATSFTLILAAEIGDKSQLVCMALASKHRPLPIILGASTAFALLNALAVSFGAIVAGWLPPYVTAATVAVLFLLFGIQALRTVVDETAEDVKEKSGHGIFLTTFLLITVAEFGDKTQLAVVGLSSTYHPSGVWLGATLALMTTSTLGVLAGKKLLQKVPLELLHKLGGILFLLLAAAAIAKAYQNYAG